MPPVINNLRYWGAPRNAGFVLMPNELQAYRVGPKAYESKGTNGFMLTLDMNSKDPKTLCVLCASVVTLPGELRHQAVQRTQVGHRLVEAGAPAGESRCLSRPERLPQLQVRADTVHALFP